MKTSISFGLISCLLLGSYYISARIIVGLTEKQSQDIDDWEKKWGNKF